MMRFKCARHLLGFMALLGALTCTHTAAQVRAAEFGANEGYPYAMGWPFRTIPAFRMGALTGKGLAELEPVAPYFWLTTESTATELPRNSEPFSMQSDALSLMEKQPIMAMLLIKKGQVVFEQYRYGTSPDTLFDSQSIAKTFTALTLGTLFDEGLLPDLDAPLAQVVPALSGSPIGLATIRQALHMQCGHLFKWSDDGPQSSAGLYAGVKFARSTGRAKNLYDYFKTLPPTEPGSRFSYDPHCSDALSMLVTQLTGQSLRENFHRRLWLRLGPQRRAAWLSPSRHPELTSGANGFYASLQDYGKLAMLYLNQGQHQGAQLVSRDWMRRMHEDVVEVGNYPSNFKRYGYQTWVRDRSSDSWFAGLGNYGQRFYLDPKSGHAMVVFALDFSHIPASDQFWDWFRR